MYSINVSKLLVFYYREKKIFFHSASIKINIVVQVSAAGNICVDRIFFGFLHQPNTFALSLYLSKLLVLKFKKIVCDRNFH